MEVATFAGVGDRFGDMQTRASTFSFAKQRAQETPYYSVVYKYHSVEKEKCAHLPQDFLAVTTSGLWRHITLSFVGCAIRDSLLTIDSHLAGLLLGSTFSSFHPCLPGNRQILSTSSPDLI